MRVSKEQTAHNRRRIVSAAARLFRENGIASSGIDAIARRAGLTHGAFYSQFDSKERVTAEAIRLTLERSQKTLEAIAQGKKKRQAFADIVDAYLARRPDPARAGRSPPGADIARQPAHVARVHPSEGSRSARRPRFDGVAAHATRTPSALSACRALILARRRRGVP
jgi:TetR/AcrR family transcriptional repressor of nem operon